MAFWHIKSNAVQIIYNPQADTGDSRKQHRYRGMKSGIGMVSNLAEYQKGIW